MSLLPDYSTQALHYDDTRSASPSVMRALRRVLEGAPGDRLIDIGGGTGNYAVAFQTEGWRPTVVDRSAAMLERAAGKGLAAVRADAQCLPFPDACFDVATMISMLHHVEDRRLAIGEARRMLRLGGRLVVKGFTDEDAATLWILDYFPVSRAWMAATHPARSAFLRELPGAQLTTLEFEDMEDGSLAALSADPARVLQAAETGATSYFERLHNDHPEDLRQGIEQLRRDIDAGRAPRGAGSATLLVWTKT